MKKSILTLTFLALVFSCQTSDEYINDNSKPIESVQEKARPVRGKHPIFVVKQAQEDGSFLSRDIVERHINRRPEKLGVFINDGQGFLEYYTFDNGWQIFATEDQFVSLLQDISALRERIKVLEDNQ